jgi:hypothetical protein
MVFFLRYRLGFIVPALVFFALMTNDYDTPHEATKHELPVVQQDFGHSLSIIRPSDYMTKEPGFPILQARRQPSWLQDLRKPAKCEYMYIPVK